MSYQQPHPQATRFHASGTSQWQPSSQTHASWSINDLAHMRATYIHRMDYHAAALRDQFRLTPEDIQRMMYQIPDCPVDNNFSIKDDDTFDHIAACERNYPVNARTRDAHLKGLILSHGMLWALTQWLNEEDPNFGGEVDRRSVAIWEGLVNLPAAAPSLPPLSIPRVNPRPLAPGEFCPIRNPLGLYGKTFKMDGEVVFKVVSCTELLNGEMEFKLRYDTKYVEVDPERLQSMLKRCVYYPVS